MSSSCGSNAPGGDRHWNRSCPCCAATSALGGVAEGEAGAAGGSAASEGRGGTGLAGVEEGAASANAERRLGERGPDAGCREAGVCTWLFYRGRGAGRTIKVQDGRGRARSAW